MNPDITGGFDQQGEYYDGVNLNNGELLRVRHVDKVGKDLTGRYLYTAYLSSTPNKYDVEQLQEKVGTAVAFSLPYRLNDMVNSKYSEEYKKTLKNGIIAMLSDGYNKSIKPDGRVDDKMLYDIGGLDKNGNRILNEKGEVSDLIIGKIKEIEKKYTIKKAEEQREER